MYARVVRFTDTVVATLENSLTAAERNMSRWTSISVCGRSAVLPARD